MSATLPDRHLKAPPGKAGDRLAGSPTPPRLWISKEGKQGVAVFLNLSQVASDFFAEGEGSERLRTGAREAAGEGAHGGASAWATSRKQNERPCVSNQAPRQPGSGLHAAWRDSSWHQLQSGTMHGFLSFFFFSLKRKFF